MNTRIMKAKGFGLLISFTLSFQFFISGCMDKIDTDLVGSSSCSPPCWMGIQPGMTNRTDALHLLEQMEIEKKGSLIILDTGTIKWLNDTPKRYYLYSENDTINKIKIDFRPVSTNLEVVISHFGDPNNLKLGKISGDGYFVSIYYPNKGLVIVVGGNKSLYEVYPKMKVVFIYYLQPGNVSKLEESLNGEDAAIENVLNLKIWEGYGVYKP